MKPVEETNKSKNDQENIFAIKDIFNITDLETYLNDPDTIKKIKLMRKHYTVTVNFNMVRYERTIDNYKKLINLTAKLVKELGLPNNSISYSFIVSELLHDGYLSKNNKFTPTVNHQFMDILGCFGLDVINGFGCCRHISSIHQDIFNSSFLNELGHNLYCFFPSDISADDDFSKKPKHVVNLIKYKGMYYMHDTLNRLFYKFQNNFVMESYPNYLGYDPLLSTNILNYEPLRGMLYNGFTQSETLDFINEFNGSNKSSYILNDELDKILNETNHNYNTKSDMLQDFVHDANSYMKEILPLRESKIMNFIGKILLKNK